jgi:hypothetical protein
VYQARKRRKLKLQLIREAIQIENRTFNLQKMTDTSSIYSSSSSCSFSPSSSKYSSSSNSDALSTAKVQNQSHVNIFEFDFKLPKHDFFLYSIQEHSKTYNNKKFSIKRKLTNLTSLASLSRSEPVLAPPPGKIVLND